MALLANILHTSSAFCDGTCQWGVYRHLFHAADKLCENQLKACSLSANVRHAYRHFLFPK